MEYGKGLEIDKSLDKLDDLLEEAWNLPLMGGRRMVDIQKVREIIDDIRLNIPQALKDAKHICEDREDIVNIAKREADDIIKRAENRARQLVNDDEIVKAAQARATKMLTESTAKTREMERASLDFAENSLKKSEDALMLAYNEIKTTRQAFRSKAKRTAVASMSSGPDIIPKK